MTRLMRTAVCVLLAVMAGCASMLGAPASSKHAGSVVDYLYPDATAAPQLQPEVTRLRPPVRVDPGRYFFSMFQSTSRTVSRIPLTLFR